MVNATGDGGLSDTGFMRGQKPGCVCIYRFASNMHFQIGFAHFPALSYTLFYFNKSGQDLPFALIQVLLRSS